MCHNNTNSKQELHILPHWKLQHNLPSVQIYHINPRALYHLTHFHETCSADSKMIAPLEWFLSMSYIEDTRIANFVLNLALMVYDLSKHSHTNILMLTWSIDLVLSELYLGYQFYRYTKWLARKAYQSQMELVLLDENFYLVLALLFL